MTGNTRYAILRHSPIGRQGGQCEGCREACSSVEVTTESSGRASAAVHVHGSLCDAALPGLLTAIDDLQHLGVVDVTVDLSHMTPCPRQDRAGDHDDSQSPDWQCHSARQGDRPDLDRIRWR